MGSKRPEEREASRTELPNIDSARFLRFAWGGEGSSWIGCGFRLDSTRVLTTRQALDKEKSVRIHGGRGESVVGTPEVGEGRVLAAPEVCYSEEKEADEGGELICLKTEAREPRTFWTAVELTAHLEGRSWCALVPATPRDGKDLPLRWRRLDGTVKDFDSERGRWQLEVRQRTLGTADPAYWQGCAVFVEAVGRRGLCLIGLLATPPDVDVPGVDAPGVDVPGVDVPDADEGDGKAPEGEVSVFEMVPISPQWPADSASVSAEGSVAGPGAGPETHCRKILDELEYLLSKPEALDPLLDEVPAWRQQWVSAKQREMAKVLCLETHPTDLVEIFFRAQEKLRRRGNPGAVGILREILLCAMPAALLARGQFALADKGARRVQPGVASREFAEMAMSAFAGLPAEMSEVPYPGSSIPRARYHVAAPGDLGPDPTGEATALLLTDELVRQSDMDDESRLPDSQNIRVLIRLLTQSLGEGVSPLVRSDDVKGLHNTEGMTPERFRQRIFELANQRLARGFGAGRFFYTLDPARPDEQDKRESLPAQVLEILSELRIVTLIATEEDSAQERALMDRLHDLLKQSPAAEELRATDIENGKSS